MRRRSFRMSIFIIIFLVLRCSNRQIVKYIPVNHLKWDFPYSILFENFLFLVGCCCRRCVSFHIRFCYNCCDILSISRRSKWLLVVVVFEMCARVCSLISGWGVINLNCNLESHIHLLPPSWLCIEMNTWIVNFPSEQINKQTIKLPKNNNQANNQSKQK